MISSEGPDATDDPSPSILQRPEIALPAVIAEVALPPGDEGADLRTFIGPNADAFLSQPKRRFGRICWPGFLVPTAWFLYRKMYGLAAATILLPWLAILSVGPRFSLGTLIAVFGSQGRRLYRHHAAKRLADIRRDCPDPDQAKDRILAEGGVSVAGAWIGAVITLIPIAVITFVAARHQHLVPAKGVVQVVAAWHFAAMLVAVVPGLFFMLVLVRLGRGRVPAGVIATAAALGGMIAIVPASLSVFEQVFKAAVGVLIGSATTAFVFAGLFEEGAKLIVAMFILRPYLRGRNPRDLVLATAGIALGFAMIENVGTVLGSGDIWERTAIYRALVAVPMHTFLGLYLGYGVARADMLPTRSGRWTIEQTFDVIKTLLIAAALHGLYDFPLFIASHAPFFPTPIQQIASAFSLETPVFLTLWVSLDMLAICCVATLAATWAASRDEQGVSTPKARGLSRLVSYPAIGVVLLLAVALSATALGSLVLRARGLDVAPELTWPATSALWVMATATLLLLVSFGWTGRTVIVGTVTVVISASALVTSSIVLETARRTMLAAILIASAQIEDGGGHLTRAAQNLTSALALDATSLPALVLRATILDKERNYASAYEDLKRAIGLAPHDARLYAARAQELDNLHDPVFALRDIDQAIALDPKTASFHGIRFQLLMSQNRVDDAAAEIAKGAMLEPDTASVHLERAEVATRRDDTFKALAEFDDAIHVAPKEDIVWSARGRFRFDQGNFRGAAQDLASAALLGGDAYTLLWLDLARARSGGNGYPELAFWSRRVDRAYWPGPLVDFFLGVRSMPSALRAARTADERCEADFYSGEWLILQGQRQTAAALLRAAAKGCPDSYVEKAGAAAELARLVPAIASTAPPTASPAPPATATTPAAPASPAPTRPTAFLTDGRCNGTGTAQWQFILPDAAQPQRSALEMRVAIDADSLDATLVIEPQPDGNSQMLMRAPAKPGGLAIDGVGNPTISNADGTLPSLLIMRPFATLWSGYLRTWIAQRNLGADMHLLSAGSALVLPIRTRTEGSCNLSVTLDAPAHAAIRQAWETWTSTKTATP